MKKLFPLLMLSAVTLMSCSKSTAAGTYVFQMGKDKGIHAGISMTLTDTVYYSGGENKEELGKAFRLQFDVKTRKDEEEIDPIAAAIEMLYSLLGDGEAIIGYYNLGEKDFNNETIVRLGYIFDDSVKQLAALIFDTDPSTLTDFIISPEAIERLVYTTYTGKYLNLILPVSAEDLRFQLYWYGYDFYVDSSDNYVYEELPEESRHTPGTHPTKEDVEAINSDETYKTHHPDLTFRNYHALTLGLTKQ